MHDRQPNQNRAREILRGLAHPTQLFKRRSELTASPQEFLYTVLGEVPLVGFSYVSNSGRTYSADLSGEHGGQIAVSIIGESIQFRGMFEGESLVDVSLILSGEALHRIPINEKLKISPQNIEFTDKPGQIYADNVQQVRITEDSKLIEITKWDFDKKAAVRYFIFPDAGMVLFDMNMPVEAIVRASPTLRNAARRSDRVTINTSQGIKTIILDQTIILQHSEEGSNVLVYRGHENNSNESFEFYSRGNKVVIDDKGRVFDIPRS